MIETLFTVFALSKKMPKINIVTQRLTTKELLLFFEPKLCNGEIWWVCCLQSFVSGDSDSDVRLLDHGHVVRAVADGQADLVGVFLNLEPKEKILTNSASEVFEP